MNLTNLKTNIEAASKIEVDYKKAPTVSYSQFSMYASCPKSWELAYLRKLRTYKPSIHTVFGTSFHETLQHYLTLLYSTTIKESDAFDFRSYLQGRLVSNYQSEIVKITQKETSKSSQEETMQLPDEFNPHFTSPEQLREFLEDGVAILNWIRKRRKIYFGPKGYELLGIEVPLYLPVKGEEGKVMFVAFVDLILYDKDLNRVLIIDIKTSTRGWSEDDKKNDIKKSQVMLYKHYFSKQFNVDVNDIEVTFFIVRRKIDPESEFPQKRVQIFKPAQKTPSINKAIKRLHQFTDTAFTSEGKYNSSIIYPAIQGENGKNCRFCEFKDRLDLCPAGARFETLPHSRGDDSVK